MFDKFAEFWQKVWDFMYKLLGILKGEGYDVPEIGPYMPEEDED